MAQVTGGSYGGTRRQGQDSGEIQRGQAMAGFQGADTEALRTMAQMVVRRSDLLEDLYGGLKVLVEDVEWVGEDADRFRGQWAGVVRPGLEDCSLDLRRRARLLIQHADEQDAASTIDFFSASHAFQAGVAAGAGLAAALGGALAGGAAGGLAAALSGAAQALRDALLGDGSTPEQRALAALLDSPMGRLGLLAGLVGGMIGGPVGAMIGKPAGRCDARRAAAEPVGGRA